jgi:hypothetical protein
MKKLSVAILVVFLMGLSYAVADEITFRDISWRSSPAEFEQALKSEGIDFQYDHTYSNDGFTTDDIWFDPAWLENPEEMANIKLSEYSRRFKSADSESPICYAAGYAVTSIYATFLPLYNVATNWIGSTASQTILFSAKYQIYLHEQKNKYTISYNDIWDDLYAKLTNLYGVPGETETSKGGLASTRTTTWIAFDGTSVKLEYTYGDTYGVLEWIIIEYTAAEIEEYKAGMASIIVAKHQKLMDSYLPNTDGL